MIQMDSIQRSQKLLEARLQDMQTTLKQDESVRRDDARHVRLVMTELQKALEAIVRSMSSTQDGVQSTAAVLMAMCRAMNANINPGFCNFDELNACSFVYNIRSLKMYAGKLVCTLS